MSDATCHRRESPNDKPLAWLHGEIKTPPWSAKARILAGYLLRRLQRGDNLGMPESRPMPSVGPRCHELRIPDGKVDWRVMYRVDDDAVLILAVFPKKTQKTPAAVISACKQRMKRYDQLTKDQ